MILTKTVNMRWTIGNRRFYEDLGYEFTKYGGPLEVRVQDLPRYSHQRVRVSCDVCGMVDELALFTLTARDNPEGLDLCRGCSHRRKKTGSVQAGPLNKLKELAPKSVIEFSITVEEDPVKTLKLLDNGTVVITSKERDPKLFERIARVVLES